MSFRLYPLTESKIDNISEIVRSAHAELKLGSRATVKSSLDSVKAGYASRSMAVYVDSVEQPKHCLVLATMPGIATDGLLVAVILIYSLPEHRADPSVTKAMMETIENYSKLNGASCILGSSWKFGGTKGIDALWKANGYVPQETVYVKLLE